MKTEKIRKVFEQFKIIFQKFPGTFIATVALTCFYAIVVDADWMTETIFTNVSTFGVLFAITCFFIESTFSSKPLKFKISLYIFNAVFSLILTFAINHKESFLGLSNETYINYLYRFITCYVLSIFVFSIYSLFKNRDLPINEYLVKTTIAMFKNTILYGLLAIGLLLICLAFISLILEGKSYTLISRIEILLFGVFYVPKMFFAFTAPEDEVGKFAKVVIKYVLGLLVFAAFVVIYIYMLKLLILWKVPSNQIYRITAGLFILGCPIWTLVSYFKDNDLIEKINSKLPFAFIPFIFLQMYSIGIRIYEYGLTPARYVCVALIIFEIIYLIAHHFDKEKLIPIFYSLIVIIIIAGIVPLINMFKLSQISQYNIVKSAKQSIANGTLEGDRVSKATGACAYLMRTEEGEKLLNSLLSKEDKELLINYKKDYYTQYDFIKRIYGSININSVNVFGYNTIYQINESISPQENLDQFEFNVGKGKVIKGNITPLINKYKEQSESSFDRFFEGNNEYVINNNLKLVLDYFSLSYDNNLEEITFCAFSGYLLEK